MLFLSRDGLIPLIKLLSRENTPFARSSSSLDGSFRSCSSNSLSMKLFLVFDWRPTWYSARTLSRCCLCWSALPSLFIVFESPLIRMLSPSSLCTVSLSTKLPPNLLLICGPASPGLARLMLIFFFFSRFLSFCVFSRFLASSSLSNLLCSRSFSMPLKLFALIFFLTRTLFLDSFLSRGLFLAPLSFALGSASGSSGTPYLDITRLMFFFDSMFGVLAFGGSFRLDASVFFLRLVLAVSFLFLSLPVLMTFMLFAFFRFFSFFLALGRSDLFIMLSSSRSRRPSSICLRTSSFPKIRFCSSSMSSAPLATRLLFSFIPNVILRRSGVRSMTSLNSRGFTVSASSSECADSISEYIIDCFVLCSLIILSISVLPFLVI